MTATDGHLPIIGAEQITDAFLRHREFLNKQLGFGPGLTADDHRAMLQGDPGTITKCVEALRLAHLAAGINDEGFKQFCSHIEDVIEEEEEIAPLDPLAAAYLGLVIGLSAGRLAREEPLDQDD